ncbi:MAG: SDR family NAD(P)-dependent oxidoreductase [Magnetococcales bacterium]|nr:SDR family NAD(P)-dependent oxidoreductase [Magnetococcales bacterium]MBF0150881.1 SDR family NAD(P)-dependent oxidoreductase [Magnetococcales bacterium]MBF0348027.1 SDR family NAD(P)-dependent oxidoreductase [Magnetococcales bacterium]MBF0629392.1 SDR family NAD(P)-dependent oxidoreductase [Magnetococcales bacterium]
MTVTGKTVLITGCSSGIGHASARILKNRGWRVFATARKHTDVERLRQEGFESVRLDLNDSQSIREGLDQILSLNHGRLDALFNNGAYGQPGAMEDLSREALRQQFETNLFGTHELTRLVLPVMRRQGGGRVLQNSSILGFVALPYRGAYVATKFALEGMTQAMRLEMRGTGIHFILIQPGPINTPFRDNARRAFLEHIPVATSHHAKRYDRWLQERTTDQSSEGWFSLPPEAVVDKVIHALESPRPRLRYGVTVPTHIAAWLRRALSFRMLERLLARG